jgi:hypothetical protein
LPRISIDVERFVTRLQVISALTTGAAVAVSTSDEPPDDAYFELLQRTAEQILLGR